ncbi:MAG: methylenetetrahydrofolate--tRNA-(uracil(54)-C(5))-methyltransferase (FADH(2)-oxidizing) TrmFO [Deltaproteobacteria bacterium]|uniref:Methylenetetrahydrofolate--tRNA-(uracil-5-)-methyltransferase TrmFO n=1 Tax=Candidatus Zymogenus saltonus TaxID=2844893 RepID=A0A9D8KC10_9DELT|nr:methylenetetrahydrofolate--tRNA-(uracil(54)-C(5))-methyltransferase (FADH(2)-oxidizing) TrmFO [Candidatus Zymogenus saltonus]
MPEIVVIGGGLAGSEAAWKASKMGVKVTLYEMKPKKFSPAHKSGGLAELVCSNSLRSESEENASGLLKKEMTILDSIIISAAEKTRVPAGSALAVDRQRFSEYITDKLKSEPNIEIVTEEVGKLEFDVPTVVATGPLTTEGLTEEIMGLTGSDKLFFYDAISPIIFTESINMNAAFRGSRYGKGGDDYINLPMSEEEYYGLVREIKKADEVTPHSFEDKKIFEGCLPIEVMVRRGDNTLAFGPMKPVGLEDPKTGERPFAVVQLRQENKEGTLYNIVGFQTRLKQGEQDRVFRMIPGLENAQFARYGSVHRNTFISSPRLLFPTLELKRRPGLFISGQLVGVEGYVESAAMGILSGINAALLALNEGLMIPPRDTALGSLVSYITDKRNRDFQPMNINFGLFPSPPAGVRKKDRKRYMVKRALKEMGLWEEKISRLTA